MTTPKNAPKTPDDAADVGDDPTPDVVITDAVTAPPDPPSERTENAMTSAFHLASPLARPSEKVILLALAWLTFADFRDGLGERPSHVQPDAVAALTGLGYSLVETTLRKMAKDHAYVGRKAWLDADERKQVAYTFVVDG